MGNPTACSPFEAGKQDLELDPLSLEGGAPVISFKDGTVDSSNKLVAGPSIFSVNIPVTDGISMGTQGMRYSLVSRDVIADSIETAVAAEGFDVVGLQEPFAGASLVASRAGAPIIPCALVGSEHLISKVYFPRLLIPAGAEYYSDPVALTHKAGADLAISLYFKDAPARQTGPLLALSNPVTATTSGETGGFCHARFQQR